MWMTMGNVANVFSISIFGKNHKYSLSFVVKSNTPYVLYEKLSHWTIRNVPINWSFHPHWTHLTWLPFVFVIQFSFSYEFICLVTRGFWHICFRRWFTCLDIYYFVILSCYASSTDGWDTWVFTFNICFLQLLQFVTLH